MTTSETPSGAPAPTGRAGRNLPAAIASGVVLLALVGGGVVEIIYGLLRWQPAWWWLLQRFG